MNHSRKCLLLFFLSSRFSSILFSSLLLFLFIAFFTSFFISEIVSFVFLISFWTHFLYFHFLHLFLNNKFTCMRYFFFSFVLIHAFICCLLFLFLCSRFNQMCFPFLSFVSLSIIFCENKFVGLLQILEKVCLFPCCWAHFHFLFCMSVFFSNFHFFNKLFYMCFWTFCFVPVLECFFLPLLLLNSLFLTDDKSFLDPRRLQRMTQIWKLKLHSIVWHASVEAWTCLNGTVMPRTSNKLLTTNSSVGYKALRSCLSLHMRSTGAFPSSRDPTKKTNNRCTVSSTCPHTNTQV